jgi:hypothetical protein
MNKAEIEALFAKFVRNEGNDRAEVRDTLFKMSSSDRVKLLTSVEFVDIAVKNAAALGVKPRKKRKKKPVRSAVLRETPNDTMKHGGLSVCKSLNGISVMPVNGEGDTEVCISLEDGVINIRVYNCGQDDYSAALIVPASTRGEKT